MKICRALKEAGKTDCFYYQQGEKIVGKEALEKLLDYELMRIRMDLEFDIREGLGRFDLDEMRRAFRRDKLI